MPVLVDDDLQFEDGPGAFRPSVAVNQWLRELPASGCPSPGSWESYARVLKDWAEFLSGHGVGLFDSRGQLKLALGKYAEYRAAGPAERRFAATTWDRHMSILSSFYRWAIAEGHAGRPAVHLLDGTGPVRRDRPRGEQNLAVRRTPEAARDGEVPGAGLHPSVPGRAAGPGTRPGPVLPGRVSWPATPRSGEAGAGDRDAAAGVHLPAALGDPAAAAPARPTAADPVPGPGCHRQGPQVPHRPGFPTTPWRPCITTWRSTNSATVDGLNWRPAARLRRAAAGDRPGRAGRARSTGSRAGGTPSLHGRAPRRLGRARRRDVHPRGEGRRRPVHRLGLGLRAHREPDQGPS